MTVRFQIKRNLQIGQFLSQGNNGFGMQKRLSPGEGKGVMQVGRLQKATHPGGQLDWGNGIGVTFKAAGRGRGLDACVADRDMTKGGVTIVADHVAASKSDEDLTPPDDRTFPLNRREDFNQFAVAGTHDASCWGNRPLFAQSG